MMTTLHDIPASTVLNEAVNSGVIDAETLAEVHGYIDSDEPGTVLGELLAVGALDTEALLWCADIDPASLDLDVTTVDVIDHRVVVGEDRHDG